jgi:fatty-acyl-CoA synthase
VAGWNWADVWETVADQRPDATALIHGSRRVSWHDFDRGADGVAAGLLAAGAQRQDKVAQYLYNCPEYLESLFGIVKAGLVPVNTNYRYVDDELLYLWDNADAVAVIFHGSFTDRCERLRSQLPRVRSWVWVDDGAGSKPDWATDYAAWADSGRERDTRVVPEHGRDGDDLYMLYTGGTTGMPKGVMWRQNDLFNVFSESTTRDPVEADLDHIRARLESGFAPLAIPACPLMHGTGAFLAFQNLFMGGGVVTLEGRSFDAVELLTAIETNGVSSTAIVGDVFAKPIVRALAAQPNRWDLTSLKFIISSGVMWSEPVKQELLSYIPGLVLVDAFSSSEALGMGSSISGGTAVARTAKFQLGARAKVITEDRRFAGPGETGLVAIGGWQPLGYYKDPEKTARTFWEVEGQRFSVPGDYARIEDDGSVTLLGRGSQCINTGGEKVYPEEVEEALKTHPDVLDAVVVGIPDDRFGERIVAVLEASRGAAPDLASIGEHVRSKLAAYKTPKQFHVVSSLDRPANGKTDYKRWRSYAVDNEAAPTA